MPALLQITAQVQGERPRGLLGVPTHGAVFEALEQYRAGLSMRIHDAQVKPFRLGQIHWQEVSEESDEGTPTMTFQVGVLDDDVLGDFIQALQPNVVLGRGEDATFRGEILDCALLSHESYAAMHARHASEVVGRYLHFELLSPTAFRTNDLDSPFPVPKTLFYGLQRKWETFSGLHLGDNLNNWISRSVRVADFRLFPRNVTFKGQRGARAKASVGTVTFQIVRPSEGGPTFARLLAEYANYSGVGYKTAYGLGHVEVEILSDLPR